MGYLHLVDKDFIKLLVFSLNSARSLARCSLRNRISAYPGMRWFANECHHVHTCKWSTKSPSSPMELGCITA